MSTNALIGRMRQDGSIEYLYCHSFAMPDDFGKAIANVQDLDTFFAQGHRMSSGKEATAQSPKEQAEWCYAASRPQYIIGKKASICPDKESYIAEAEAIVQYVYLWEDERWKWANTVHSRTIVLRPLSKEFENDYPSMAKARSISREKGRRGDYL